MHLTVWPLLKNTWCNGNDEIWLRFKGETLKHKDVCLRKWLYYPEESH